MPDSRILVVEDETNVRELEAEILREEWEHVDTAVDGTDALRLLAEHVYAAIVSDLAMPKLDGRGLYEEVERRWPRSTTPSSARAACRCWPSRSPSPA